MLTACKQTPPDTGQRSARNQRRHDVINIGLELLVLHPWLAQLQGDLQKSDVGGIGEVRAVLGFSARQSNLTESQNQIL